MTQQMKHIGAVVLGIALSSGGCVKTVRIEPPRPAASPVSPIQPLLSDSSVAVPIAVPISLMASAAESNIPTTFTDVLQLGSASAGPFRARNIRAEPDLRRGSVTFTPQGERLAFSFPISGNIVFRAQIIPLVGGGFGVRETAENVQGTMSGWLSLGLDSNWALAHSSDASLDVQRADIRLFGRFNVSARSAIQNAVNAKVPEVLSRALAEVGPRLRVRENAEAAWSRLHLQEVVNEKPRILITLDPTGVVVSPLRFAEDGHLRTGIGITARTATYITEVIPQPVPAKPLPALQAAPPSNAINVIMPVSVQVSTLMPSVRAALVGKTFDVPGDVKFTPKDVDIWLNGDVAFLKVAFNAKKLSRPKVNATGVVYARGQVTWDPTEKVLKVTGIAYDVATDNLLIQLASWLRRPEILARLESAAVLRVEPELEKARQAAGAQVAKLKTPPPLDLKVAVTSVEVADVRPADDMVYLLTNVKGTAEASIAP